MGNRIIDSGSEAGYMLASYRFPIRELLCEHLPSFTLYRTAADSAAETGARLILRILFYLIGQSGYTIAVYYWAIGQYDDLTTYDYTNHTTLLSTSKNY